MFRRLSLLRIITINYNCIVQYNRFYFSQRARHRSRAIQGAHHSSSSHGKGAGAHHKACARDQTHPNLQRSPRARYQGGACAHSCARVQGLEQSHGSR